MPQQSDDRNSIGTASRLTWRSIGTELDIQSQQTFEDIKLRRPLGSYVSGKTLKSSSTAGKTIKRSRTRRLGHLAGLFMCCGLRKLSKPAVVQLERRKEKDSVAHISLTPSLFPSGTLLPPYATSEDTNHTDHQQVVYPGVDDAVEAGSESSVLVEYNTEDDIAQTPVPRPRLLDAAQDSSSIQYDSNVSVPLSIERPTPMPRRSTGIQTTREFDYWMTQVTQAFLLLLMASNLEDENGEQKITSESYEDVADRYYNDEEDHRISDILAVSLYSETNSLPEIPVPATQERPAYGLRKPVWLRNLEANTSDQNSSSGLPDTSTSQCQRLPVTTPESYVGSILTASRLEVVSDGSLAD